MKSASGVFDTGRAAFSTWRPCSIHLTNQRLLLSQVKKVVMEFYLDRIDKLETVLRPCIAGKKAPQLVIALQGGGAKKYYIGVAQPHIWLRQIAELTGLGVEKNK